MSSNDPFPDNADLIRAIEDAPPRGDIPLPQSQLFKGTPGNSKCSPNLIKEWRGAGK
jgi:hypothetical protein